MLKKSRLIYTGEYDADITRYIPGMLYIMFQDMLVRIETIERSAHISYEHKETFQFQLLLDQNFYANVSSLHLCFPIN